MVFNAAHSAAPPQSWADPPDADVPARRAGSARCFVLAMLVAGCRWLTARRPNVIGPRGSARARHPCRPPRGIKRCQASCRSAVDAPNATGSARTPSFPACANCCKRWRAQTRDVERDDNGSCAKSPAGPLALAKPSISVAFTAQDSLLMRRARRTVQTSAAWWRRSRGGRASAPMPRPIGMNRRDHQPNRAICATNCNQERPAVKTYLLEDSQLGNGRDLTRGNDAS